MYIISHFQAKEILDGYVLQEDEIECSLDLGMSRVKIKRDENDFVLPDGQRIMVKLITKILGDQKVCYLLEENNIYKVSTFNEDTNKFYKLLPTGLNTPPTVEISGIRMHVTKSMHPGTDTRKKIKEISPVKGKVLDTCRGLGYTAIAALKAGARHIVCCEKDLGVTEIAKYNPYSKELFDNEQIELKTGDSFELVKKFKNNEFTRIIHDPPTISLAGTLYSGLFYTELYRILKPKGILYHYTGAPGSKKRNMDVPGNVTKRLKLAGFVHVKVAHFGIRAEKP